MTTTTAQHAVHVQGVSKAFGSAKLHVQAVDDVSLRIDPNQLVMLVGPSGCGKTTLVSIISGVLRPDAGEVAVFGTDWDQLREDDRTRKRGELVGFVFQDFNLLPTLTAVENVAVPLLIRGLPRRDAYARAGEVLESVGLAARGGARPSELSGGMQQRVAIARALAPRPRLLVCDEPTANLDAHTGQSVMQLIRDASRPDEKGSRCVIVVTHDARIFHFADRIEEMEDGQIKPEPSEEIREAFRRSHEGKHHH